VLKQRILRYSLGLALTFLILAHASGHLPISFLSTLENLSYDFRLDLSLPENVDKKVVIIDIDEKSLGEIGQWPWQRNVIAKIVDNLFENYQVDVLGFDIVFAEKDEAPSDNYLINMASTPLADNEYFSKIYTQARGVLYRDKTLARALANRKTIMGMVFDPRDQSLKKGSLPEPLSSIPADFIESSLFPNAAGYTANLAILQENALSGGFFDNPLIDDDGVFRKVPLLQEYEGQLYQSLSLAIARASLQNNQLELKYALLDKANKQISLEWLQLGNIIIPVDQNSGALVPYIGKQRSFEYYSAADVYHNQVPKEKLHNKIAIFGTSAAGLLDLRTTPLESAFPGVEVHANLVQGILDQTIMHKPQYIIGYEILVLLVFGLALTLWLPALSPLWASLVSAAAVMLLLGIEHYIWNSLQIVSPIATPLLLVFLIYILNMTYGFFVETRGKRQLTHLFGQYVPPELVDEMSQNLKEINLDGEIREMSVLFTDVRNFTTISENMEPRELTQFINSFLTPLTRIIHHNRGTIDKYMGDAIMAFWGAPLADDQHARNALTAGMEMLQAMDEMRDEFNARGWPEIRIGVGINTGPMNVGNKGSEFRVDYTVLGDAVNLGSRMEGLTKNYGVEIITGEATRHAVPEFEYRELDRVRVKGKDQPVTLYEPLGLVETIDKGLRNSVKRFHHALQLYRQQKWDDAEQELFSLSQHEPERQIYRIYLDRIAYYRQHPPGENWDGVFTHTSK
jgi:adenylate cyclase